MKPVRIASAGLCITVALLCAPALAHADATIGPITYTVESAPMDTNCSLREAVTEANTNTASADCAGLTSGTPGDDTITLSNQSFQLLGTVGDDVNMGGDLDVTTSPTNRLTITGGGPALTQLHSGVTDRVLDLNGGGGVLNLRDLRVENGGNTNPVTGNGGGIRAASSISLDHVRVTQSKASANGGGIASSGGNVTLAGGSRVDTNTAAADGGGLWLHGAGASLTGSEIDHNTTFGTSGAGGGGIEWAPGSAASLTLLQTTIDGNTALSPGASGGVGGGIKSIGSVTLDHSSLTANSAVGAGSSTFISGGGLWQNGSGGSATVIDSTVSENFAIRNNTGTVSGGGIYSLNSGSPTVRIVRSTVALNKVMGGTIERGGGIYGLNPGELEVSNSTLVGNSAPNASGDGGAIWDNGVNVLVSHSTFADNDAAGAAKAISLVNTSPDTIRNSIIGNGASACAGDLFTTAGYNLDQGATCWTANSTGDLQNSDPLLAPGPADNGGPTETIALLAGSPAIDRVQAGMCFDTDGATLLTVDQRGLPRPGGAACDSGAFEVQPPPTAVAPTPTTTATTPSAARKRKCRKKKKKSRAAAAKKCKKKKKKKKK
jgi:hypothetical protein